MVSMYATYLLHTEQVRVMSQDTIQTLLSHIPQQEDPSLQKDYCRLEPAELQHFLSFLDSNKGIIKETLNVEIDEYVLAGKGKYTPIVNSDPSTPIDLSITQNDIKTQPLFQMKLSQTECAVTGDQTFWENVSKSTSITSSWQEIGTKSLEQSMNDSLLLQSWVLVKKPNNIIQKEIQERGPCVFGASYFDDWPSFDAAGKFDVVLQLTAEYFFLGAFVGTQKLITAIIDNLLGGNHTVAGAGVLCALWMSPEIVLQLLGILVVGGIVCGTASALPILIIGSGGILVSSAVYHAFQASKRLVARTYRAYCLLM